MSPFKFNRDDIVKHENDPGHYAVVAVGDLKVLARALPQSKYGISEYALLIQDLELVPKPFFEVGKVYEDTDSEKFRPVWVGQNPKGERVAMGFGWWAHHVHQTYGSFHSINMGDWTEVEA